jgi:2-dehydro-3-deoxygluconokinase
MFEIAQVDAGQAQLGFGGDTLNTALYLARQGIAVRYLTALGDDPLSTSMLKAWQAENITVDTVVRVEGAQPGAYLVRTDASGERSFQFWRENSPARRLCALPQWPQLAATLRHSQWVYFSAITLSILDAAGVGALLAAVAAARAHGARVAFDSNYRARNWPDAQRARETIAAAYALTDLALPTFDDERALYGDSEPAQTLARLAAAGVEQIAMKLGPAGCVLWREGRMRVVAATPVHNVIDTTAAGDSFNAGLLAGLIQGEAIDAAAQRGHLLAAQVIQHRGAIIPRHAMPLLGPIQC